jgi:hypothetical protein
MRNGLTHALTLLFLAAVIAFAVLIILKVL